MIIFIHSHTIHLILTLVLKQPFLDNISFYQDFLLVASHWPKTSYHAISSHWTLVFIIYNLFKERVVQFLHYQILSTPRNFHRCSNEDLLLLLLSGRVSRWLCDLTTMGDFLRSIGSNVTKIKHIQMELGVSSYFTNCLYLLGPDEGDLEFLHDALEILGGVHEKHSNLKTIEVTYSWKAWYHGNVDTSDSNELPMGNCESLTKSTDHTLVMSALSQTH